MTSWLTSVTTLVVLRCVTAVERGVYINIHLYMCILLHIHVHILLRSQLNSRITVSCFKTVSQNNGYESTSVKHISKILRLVLNSTIQLLSHTHTHIYTHTHILIHIHVHTHTHLKYTYTHTYFLRSQYSTLKEGWGQVIFLLHLHHIKIPLPIPVHRI